MCFSSSRDREQSRFFALFLFIFSKTTEKSRRHPAKRTPIFFTLILLLLLCVDYMPPLLLLPLSLSPRRSHAIETGFTSHLLHYRSKREKKNRRSKLKDNFCTSLLDFLLFLSSSPTKRRAQLFFIAINYFLLVRSRLLTYTHVHLHADLCACTLN